LCAVDDRNQVVACCGQPDLGGRVVSVGEVEDPAVNEPSMEPDPEIGDSAGERPVQTQPPLDIGVRGRRSGGKGRKRRSTLVDRCQTIPRPEERDGDRSAIRSTSDVFARRLP
jgi:hypothetical protein